MQRRSLSHARQLRRGQTKAELELWMRLRSRQLGIKFRRQHPIGPYIADFCCLECQLIIELDGGQHAEQARADKARTSYMENHGFHVLRLWNDQVLTNIDAVLEQIFSELRTGGIH
jgi:very-short-patch-repair endonuclease